MFKVKSYLTLVLLATCLIVSNSAQSMIPDLGDENCTSLLLVSSWSRNNVKIYDGCSGEFVRDLDSQNLIDGPLGILEAPDGDVLVISENNGRMLKFDLATLSVGSVIMGDDPATTAVENNFISGPSGAILHEDGFIYAASYTRNEVVKINPQTWQIVEQMLAADNGLIQGIDAGITISGGNLYLPGYDSDNILRLNLTSKVTTNFVPAGTAGLDAPRSIMVKGQDMFVSAERSNSVMIFDATSGSFKQTLIELNRPTGLTRDGDNHFLVNNSRSVFRVANNGSTTETIVESGAGNLAGGTFVYRLIKSNPDTDGDGLNDIDEINIYGTDPQNADTDGDNLSDGDEVNIHNTNPLVADSDNDGMPDGFEVTYGLLPTVNDAAEDPDTDGLTNLGEFLAGTAPNNDDTDGDGEKDGVDSDPLVPNTAPMISGVPLSSVEQNSAFSFTPEVSYAGDLATIALSVINKPEWVEFNPANGKLSGTPDNSAVGNHTGISISATNGHHIVTMPSFEIEVVNVNDAPVLVSNIPAQSLTLGNSLSLDISENFTDIDRDIVAGSQDSLVFSAVGLPDSVSMTAQGVISGKPSAVATSAITIIATDQSGASVNSDFSLTVKKAEEAKSSGGGGASSHWILFCLMLLIMKNLISRKTFNDTLNK